MSGFYQQAPSLGNQYSDDKLLRSYLRRVLPADRLAQIEPDLRRFADRVTTDISEMAADAEAHEPRHVPFDPWGRRVDRILTSAGWRALDRVSAEEGLVAIGYERTHGATSRVWQFAKLYLFHASSAYYTCPLAMTDGAARCLELHGDETLRERALRRLTTRDPDLFWTSGQWMTERSGGSDVGQSETLARQGADGTFTLHGTKWFTSATTSQMALTLARTAGPDGSTTEGSRGLSLFYLETHRADGTPNAIVVHRLKDKLGTRALPTAELTLDGTPARLVGTPGRGVATIASLLNVTRAYNAICAAAAIRRGLALARDYASRRVAFGLQLGQHPLHLETLARLQVELAAALQLAFRVAELMGREECGEVSADERAELRLLTPLAKLFTARQCASAMSELIECFGGAGYVEDTGLPRLLRDNQVLPIWEGTTNVLSLDALRAMAKDQALEPFLLSMERRVVGPADGALRGRADELRQAIAGLRRWARELDTETAEERQAAARDLALSLARTYAASLLYAQASWDAQFGDDATSLALGRWCAVPLVPSLPKEPDRLDVSRRLALAL